MNDERREALQSSIKLLHDASRAIRKVTNEERKDLMGLAINRRDEDEANRYLDIVLNLEKSLHNIETAREPIIKAIASKKTRR